MLRQRAQAPRGTSRVIDQTTDGIDLDAVIKSLRGRPGRRLPLLKAQVAEVPDKALETLAGVPGVRAISVDRAVQGVMERTGAATGASWVRDTLGFDGTGIGVAVLDSGAAPAHFDLQDGRIAHFADFVNFQPNAYDDYGHGTHVAGIIAGSGYASGGARRGIAPGAGLVVLKVLDAAGNGYISNVIAALDYAVAKRETYNIRVINLSVAAGVQESYTTDPLTLAAKRAVDAGVVVVTAAGNLGRNGSGRVQYGGITAPGNAPWVLTVGAASHMGTTDRGDDTIAAFSSRGPSYIDYTAKPDLVAPGVGIESLTDAATLLYRTRPAARLWGTIATAAEPYLSMSGTSMAAPVVAGTIALMLQANPALTPNAVKAILQYTAENRPGFSRLAQGAGLLNARGAVELAQRFAGTVPTFPGDLVQRDGFAMPLVPTSTLTAASTDSSATTFTGAQLEGELTPIGPAPIDETGWSRHIIWGSHRLSGGMIQPDASAWGLDVTWGSPRTANGAFVAWGTVCDATVNPDCDNIVWGTAANDENIVWGTSFNGENIVWGTGAFDENIVWGTECSGQDCENSVWGTQCDPLSDSTCENIVWGTAECDAATGECENIVWGTAECDPATGACENIVWGTGSCDPTIDSTCENIVWGTSVTSAERLSTTVAPAPVAAAEPVSAAAVPAPSVGTTTGDQTWQAGRKR